MSDEPLGPHQAVAILALGRRLVAIPHIRSGPTVFLPDHDMERAIDNGDKPGGDRFPIHRRATEDEAEAYIKAWRLVLA